MPGWVLAIETSGPLGGAALWHPESHRGAEASLKEPFRHAEDLPGLVQGLLDRFGVGFADLALVAVVRGPGYFTALRVGVAYAKALWLARRVPVVAPTGLEVLAFEASEAGAREVVPVINAQRGQVYYAVYRDLKCREGPAVARPEALARKFPEARFVGPGLALFPDDLPVARGPAAYPSPLAVARWGWRRFQEAGATDAVPLEPLYIREPDAVRLRQNRAEPR